ncbi:protein kinase, partial [Streptomyces sp. NPDC127092]|uniref:protein kinase n=1 Tax=Streptomyces sp. NPDC127092 TaxID=3347135 RepID=UPI0036631F38
MDDYAGRVLADRYRLPLPPPDAYELVETRAFDTYSGQEVRIRQVPLPEVVDAELLDDQPYADQGRATRRPADPTVRRAVEAAQAAARIPDHPRLDQVFDVFAEAGSLWIVSEFVAATPLSELLVDGPLTPYRAAEMGADLLTALRALHAHGWTHRNVTARTVLVCDDGRVVLTGLAAGAAEEALCGYAPVPEADEFPYAAGPQGPEPYERPDVHEAETYEAYEDDGEYGEYQEYQGRQEHGEYGAYGTYGEYGSGDEGDEGGDGHDGHEGRGRSLTGGHEPGPRGALPRARGAEPYPDETYLEETADDEAYLDGRYADGQEPDEDGGHYEDGGRFEDGGHYEDGGRYEDGGHYEDGPGEDGTGTPGITGYGPHGGTPYGPGRAGRPELSAAPVVPVPAVPPAADPRAARAGAIA